MIKITHSVRINAPASRVWNIMWDRNTYSQWTRPFGEGSYTVSDWKQGGKAHFLLPSGEGMYVQIERLERNKCMIFRPIGEIKNFEELEPTEEMKSWQDTFEAYYLEEKDGVCLLSVERVTIESYADMFNEAYPKSFEIIKLLAEDKLQPTAMVSACVQAPIEKVWECRTNPEHIKQWNAASDDWHTPHAQNDLKPGGHFSYRMESKDGVHGFDFDGTFTAIEPNKSIEYTLSDGRKSNITLSENNGKVTIVDYFELEKSNPAEMQRTGWQAIIDNFKQYVEGES